MMARKPFDPSLIRVPPAERVPAQLAIVTPRQVNEMVRGAIARCVPSTLHVLGELGDFSRPASGHLYFTLKDAESELRCVMWRSAAASVRFEPQPGLEVIATGALEVYAPRGSYQLIVRKLEPRGVGALELAFRQLRDKLERAGLFDPARKRPLPAFPARIAIVTSPAGAAIRDIVQTIRRRYPVPELLVFPVRVQGEGAAAEIAAAIRLMNQHAAALGGIDVAIVGRGGGSLEDLWAFNEEDVARAIFASRVPIVSAVGHEVDFSISDLVADVRAATPTAAAELVTPLLADVLQRLDAAASRAVRSVRHACETASQELRVLSASEWLARPLNRLRQQSQRLDETLHRLDAATARRLHAERQRLARFELAAARLSSGAAFGAARQRLNHAALRLEQTLRERTGRGRRALERDWSRLEFAGPLARLSRMDERLRHTALRVHDRVRELLARRVQMLRASGELLEACGPRRVLARGYSITRDARTRAVLRSVAGIRDGQRVVTELADGEFRSAAEDPRQPGLFD